MLHPFMFLYNYPLELSIGHPHGRFALMVIAQVSIMGLIQICLEYENPGKFNKRTPWKKTLFKDYINTDIYCSLSFF